MRWALLVQQPVAPLLLFSSKLLCFGELSGEPFLLGLSGSDTLGFCLFSGDRSTSAFQQKLLCKGKLSGEPLLFGLSGSDALGCLFSSDSFLLPAQQRFVQLLLAQRRLLRFCLFSGKLLCRASSAAPFLFGLSSSDAFSFCLLSGDSPTSAFQQQVVVQGKLSGEPFLFGLSGSDALASLFSNQSLHFCLFSSKLLCLASSAASRCCSA